MNVSKRFVLLHEAISGTMSNFFMARDLQSGKIVGLKLLDPGKTAAFEARFKGLNKPSEGEIAMPIEAPRHRRNLEYGVTRGGALSADGVPRRPQHQRRPGRPRPLLDGRRVHFIRQAAEAIAAVHQAGFIHRDICPRNFLLTNNRSDMKLIDFGLTVPATRWFMQPGNRTGTPNYMAPELVRRHATDQRLDVFSFGVMAYEFCTFELPWPRGTTGMAAMTHDQPPADIRQRLPQIHPSLAKAIHSCIEPNMSRRCPSIEAFLRMIKAIGDEGSV